MPCNSRGSCYLHGQPLSPCSTESAAFWASAFHASRTSRLQPWAWPCAWQSADSHTMQRRSSWRWSTEAGTQG